MAFVSGPQLNDDDLELLSSYIDGQLTAEERAALEQRLEHDQTLRRELDELRATVAALRSLEPVRPPRSFTLDPAQVAPRSRLSLLRLLPLAGTMAAALMCVIVTFTVFGGGMGGAPASAPLSAPAVADAPTFAPEAGAMQAPELPPAAPAPADMANEEAASSARAATPAPAPTQAPAAAAAAQESAPIAASEPSAAAGFADETAEEPNVLAESLPATTGASGEPGVLALEAPDAAAPADTSADAAQVEAEAPAPSGATGPALAPALLIILPLLVLALGVWLYVAARRRRS